MVLSLWSDFVSPLVSIWSWITGFMKFCLSIPFYLEQWYLSLPDFIATGMTILLLIIAFFVILDIIVLVKEVF